MKDNQHTSKLKTILVCASYLTALSLTSLALEESNAQFKDFSYEEDETNKEEDFYFSEKPIENPEYEYYDLLQDQYGNVVGYIYFKENKRGQEWTRTRTN